MDSFYVANLEFRQVYISIGAIEAMWQNGDFAFCRIFVSLRCVTKEAKILYHFDYCMADINHRIFEAGLFLPNEKIVLTIHGFVLLEHFTGKKYDYRIVDLAELKAKKLFSRGTPLTERGYQRAMEKMQGAGKLQNGRDSSAYHFLTHIFCDILPLHGFALRENQLALSIAMLEAMEKQKIALCEAEVGTGKTLAYLLAATIYRLFYADKQPVVISTSTITLQKALTEEYIPQLSSILMQHRIIDRPLTFVIRKGKKHYACDLRVKTYLASLQRNNRIEDQDLIQLLTALFCGACPLDLDGLPLTAYVKGCIQVERCQQSCPLVDVCRYRALLNEAGRKEIDFQIVNHNLVLADILSKKGDRNRLLPEHRVLIFDEAHKLVDVSRQMYGISFTSMELERLAVSIRRAVGKCMEKKRIMLQCEEMLRWNTLFFERLNGMEGVMYHSSCKGIVLTKECIKFLKTLMETLNGLSAFFYAADQQGVLLKQCSGRLERARGSVFRRIFSRIGKILDKLNGLLCMEQSIYWLEQIREKEYQLCSLPKQLNFTLYEDIWSREMPYILTSATLSANGDFSHFIQRMGLDLLDKGRVQTTSKASPFDYKNHALLYLPEDMPFPEVKNQDYLDAICGKVAALIHQTQGHTLVLFTSYWMMGRVYQELFGQITGYPLFMMGKGRLDAISEFRKSGNGVLFASDSAGEGIDLAGDILSSIIIVKLPFPVPDPILEYEKSLHDDFYSYLSSTIVPSMLIKLRQWVGRGIRRETDTCVFSILDSRAAMRYREEILAALPDMPVTEQLGDVGRFIRLHKGEKYFELEG